MSCDCTKVTAVEERWKNTLKKQMPSIIYFNLSHGMVYKLGLSVVISCRNYGKEGTVCETPIQILLNKKKEATICHRPQATYS